MTKIERELIAEAFEIREDQVEDLIEKIALEPEAAKPQDLPSIRVATSHIDFGTIRTFFLTVKDLTLVLPFLYMEDVILTGTLRHLRDLARASGAEGVRAALTYSDRVLLSRAVSAYERA